MGILLKIGLTIGAAVLTVGAILLGIGFPTSPTKSTSEIKALTGDTVEGHVSIPPSGLIENIGTKVVNVTANSSKTGEIIPVQPTNPVGAGIVIPAYKINTTSKPSQSTSGGSVSFGTPKPTSLQPLDPNTVSSSQIRPSPVATTPVEPITPSQSKRLAFALLSLSNAQNVSQAGALLDNTSIDGIAIQIGWTSMETSDEVFNWTTLDAALKAGKDRSKGVTLHIFSSSPMGIAQWLKTAGVKTYTLTDFQGRMHEEALPWDQTLLSQYSQFLKSLASHISSSGYSGTLARVSVAVPVAEMDLIACRNNMLANVYSYSRATYLSSWKTMVDAHASAFPSLKKFISAPVGLICFPEKDTQFFTDVMDYASQNYGTTFVPFAADLTAEGSTRTAPYADIIAKNGVGYQPIWSSTNDSSNRMKSSYPGSLLQATCKATSSGADYVEIYAADVSNTDATIQKGIQAVHDTTLCK